MKGDGQTRRVADLLDQAGGLLISASPEELVRASGLILRVREELTAVAPGDGNPGSRELFETLRGRLNRLARLAAQAAHRYRGALSAGGSSGYDSAGASSGARAAIRFLVEA